MIVFDESILPDEEGAPYDGSLLPGCRRIKVLYAASLAGNKELDPEHIGHVASSTKGPLCIDQEHHLVSGDWNSYRGAPLRMGWSYSIQDQKKTSIELAAQVHAAREANPGIVIGFYGVFPQVGYLWNSRHIESFHRSCDRMKGMEFTRAVDAFFPRWYNDYADPSLWRTLVESHLKVLRGLGKRVYPFLNTVYTPHAEASVRGKRVDWAPIMDVCGPLLTSGDIDGIVIWGKTPDSDQIRALEAATGKSFTNP